jgi:hypothetical protein
MNSLVTSSAAAAIGVGSPYPSFTDTSCAGRAACWGSGATYSGIDTFGGGGDHSGHASCHAGIFRIERRAGRGFTLQGSYVFSKILTDSDSYWGNGVSAMDQYNRRLEKSIGQFDITHNFKFSTIYELPFGRGKAYLNKGLSATLLGGWRLSGVGFYASGQPLGLSTSVGTPSVLFARGNRPLISTYDGWRAPTHNGSFDPSIDTFVQPASFFPAQVGAQFTGTTQYFGNQTRYNPKFRQFPNLTENISLTKSFAFTERLRADLRFEAFNAFNRVRFGTGSLQIQNSQFGVLTSSGDLLNSPRQMQVGLKLYF